MGSYIYPTHLTWLTTSDLLPPALDLTPPLPSTLGVLSRWAAESVRFIYLPSSTFIANNKGYPVLPKGTQSFIRDSVAASIVSSPLFMQLTIAELSIAPLSFWLVSIRGPLPGVARRLTCNMCVIWKRPARRFRLHKRLARWRT